MHTCFINELKIWALYWNTYASPENTRSLDSKGINKCTKFSKSWHEICLYNKYETEHLNHYKHKQVY